MYRGMSAEKALEVAEMIVRYREGCEVDLNSLPVRAWVNLLIEPDEE